jgi:hypothetical protein
MSEQPPPEFNPTIAKFYHQAPEEDRLEQGAFLLEGLRTRELIERHARRPPAKVLDVGGPPACMPSGSRTPSIRCIWST